MRKLSAAIGFLLIALVASEGHAEDCSPVPIPPPQSVWFVGTGPGVPKTKAVVVVGHGLNLKPERMNSVISHLQGSGTEVLRIALTGHRGVDGEFRTVTPEIWKRDFRQGWCVARRRAETLRVPLYFVGYSLGALLAEELLATDDNKSFDRLVLFAPAVTVRWPVRLLGLLRVFGSGFEIPSKNLPDYRANSGTPVAAYRALLALIDELDAVLTGSPAARLRVDRPTMVLMDPEDEAIGREKLSEFVAQHGLKKWELADLSNSGTRLARTYHHLVVDAEALGGAEWARTLALISRHLEL